MNIFQSSFLIGLSNFRLHYGHQKRIQFLLSNFFIIIIYLLTYFYSATGQDRSPVLDMYQILNLTKRLDAVELSIEKFATILESVTRGE